MTQILGSSRRCECLAERKVINRPPWLHYFPFFRLTTVQLPFHKTEVKYSGNVGVQSLMTDFFASI